MIDRTIERVANLHFAHLTRDAIDELLVDAFFNEEATCRDTIFAFVEEDWVARLVGGRDMIR